MTALVPSTDPSTEIFYPSSDGEPLAETFDHLYAILTTLEVLRQYLPQLLGVRQGTVLANQFLYYAQNMPRLRAAPDVMVIFDVAPGGRDSYKVWEEGQVPVVVFEITSKGTQDHDQGYKRTLYEQIGVQEYWQFDPRGEWIPERLRGYRLHGELYEPITDSQSRALGLRLEIEGKLIGFYRLDNGEKLLIPDELAAALHQETVARQQAEAEAEQAQQQAEQAQQRAIELEAQLARYQAQFGELPD
jgi:Uma2 family endonuclease